MFCSSVLPNHASLRLLSSSTLLYLKRQLSATAYPENRPARQPGNIVNRVVLLTFGSNRVKPGPHNTICGAFALPLVSRTGAF